MPNLYVTVDQIREAAPDAIRSTNTDYDERFYKLANNISDWIDKEIQREIFPKIATRYYSLERGGRPDWRADREGSSKEDDLLWIDDLIEITQVSYSTDDGASFTNLTENSDYIAMAGLDFNGPGSYNLLKVDVNSSNISSWPRGQKAVKVAGTWGFTDDRDGFFEDTLDTVQNTTGLNATATSLSVSDIDALDKWGISPRISRGQLLRIESEYLEVTAVNATGNSCTVVRGVNGSTAATHAQNTQIDKFVPPAYVVEAALIQAARQFKRGQVFYGDAEALPDFGRILQIKTIDPMAKAMLEKIRKLGVDA